MLADLLISPENGRAANTYGVIPSQVRTMRLVLLTVVILWHGGTGVQGELEIIPGLQREDTPYNIRDRPNHFFEQLYLNPKWRASIPLDARLSEDFFKTDDIADLNEKLSERVRILQEFVARRKQQLREQFEKAHYMSPLARYEDEDEYVKAPVEGYDRYELKHPNQQILDDVRPYPHDDGDFSFREDEVDDSDDGEYVDVGVDKEKEASGTGALLAAAGANAEARQGLKVDEQAEFAYAPTDPRFYEDSYKPLEPNIVRIQAEDSSTDNNKNEFNAHDQSEIYLTPRMEGKFLNPQKFMEQKPENNPLEVVAIRPHYQEVDTAGVYVIAIVAGISAAATVGLIAFAIGWYNLQKHVKSATDVEYPAYGVTGPNKEVSPSGDRRLAQSAQMYHYQHQKQQIIAMESRTAPNERHGSISEADSDEENEEGDYTVYECPGLAPTGEMEVKNPLFQDDPTPAQTPGKQGDGGAVEKK